MNATCKTCDHGPDAHSSMVGCFETITTPDGTRTCDCEQYVVRQAEVHAPTPAETLEQGRDEREQGMANAGSGVAGPLASDWRAKAAEAIERLAKTGDEFSADDVVALIGEPPVPNMLGPAFMKAARADVINASGFKHATRKSAHARVQRTWKGA